ncbi:1,6-anhydro-N-acetylmuramyl-L-alanine amidase AmpD [Neptuniibacter sp.]|uniref:1,6-anhydro-N-acetylmuramyl-L-alanine amidase AmpD n=1 Tax=Neptuniibacter sp. TaxID=1962643 RepID=UPI0026185DC6|nr:1,6-anhydro-N-acetylmuramyl-L-alanine amidase AmpD [Neptuniibacter sp.]MCP4598121.1 1,6-anhydro-N-acetylmuramyl-L-alanine amidase AmpD [Neptuniibacter sp.]
MIDIGKDGWLEGVNKVPSPNYNDRLESDVVSLLVIHNISLPPRQYGGGYVHKFFQNKLPVAEHPYFATIKELEVSAHFLIERCGTVTQFVPVDKRAWHAGISQFDGREGCNDFSIGIELEGCDEDEFTSSQYLSLSELTDVLRRIYPTITQQRIAGHSDIAPGRKTDPGPCFDWERYISSLD